MTSSENLKILEEKEKKKQEEADMKRKRKIEAEKRREEREKIKGDKEKRKNKATNVKASVQCSQKSDVHEGATSEGIYLASCVKCFFNSQCSEVKCL